MLRTSNYRRSHSTSSKQTHHDLPQDIKIAPETNQYWPRKNTSKIYESQIMYRSPDSNPGSPTSPSIYSPISKEPRRSTRISAQKINADNRQNKGYNTEQDTSPLKLKEILESSIKDAMLSVVDQCRLNGKSGDVSEMNTKRKHEKKSNGHENGNNKSRDKEFTRKQRNKEVPRSRSRSVHTKSRETKKQTRKNIDRGKRGKGRSRSECTERIMDNRRMTGNVNIFICSEATEGNQGRNKQEDSRPASKESSSFSEKIPESSAFETEETVSTLSSELETNAMNDRSDILSSPNYRSNENTGSGSNPPSLIRKPSENNAKFNTLPQLENNTLVDKSTGKDVMQSAQSIVNENQSNAKSFGRFRPVIDRSDLGFFNSRSPTRDNEQPWTTVYPSENMPNFTVSEHESLKSACTNVNRSIPQRNSEKPDRRWYKDLPHKYCCARDKKLTLIDRTDTCTRKHRKQKIIPCPLRYSPKYTSVCTACNKCLVEEEPSNLIKNTLNYRRQLSSHAHPRVCKRREVSGEINLEKKLSEEHVTAIVEYAGDIGLAEAGVIAEVDTNNLNNLRKKVERQIKNDKEPAIIVDEAIGVKTADERDRNNSRNKIERRVTSDKEHATIVDTATNVKTVDDIEKDGQTKATSTKEEKTDHSITQNDKLEKAEAKLDEAKDKLVAEVQDKGEGTSEKNDQVSKNSDTPAQPQKVEFPPPKSTPRPREKLLKLGKIIERNKASKNSAISNPEKPRPTSKSPVSKVLQVKLPPIVKSKVLRRDRSVPSDKLKIDRKQSVKSRSRLKTLAMKESAKKPMQTKGPIPLKSSGSQRKRNDVRQHKRMQARISSDTKNMHSKQTAKESDSTPPRPKSFKEKVKDSLFCKTVIKVVNRLKCSECRSKKRVDKKGTTEKSAKATTTVAEKDKRDDGDQKADINLQGNIGPSQQDRRHGRPVIRKASVSRYDNKKRPPPKSSTDFPLKKQKSPEDKKDVQSDVTVADKPVDDHEIKAEKKEIDPNRRQRRRLKPKLLASIATKRTSHSSGQKIPRPPDPPKEVEIERKKSEEPEASKGKDEISVAKAEEEPPVVKTQEEIKVEDDQTQIKDIQSEEPKILRSSKQEVLDVDYIEQEEPSRKRISETKEFDRRAEVKQVYESDVDEDKVKSESIEIRVPQPGSSKVDIVDTHPAEDTHVTPHIHVHDTIQHEIKEFEDICDHSKCVHYPKSCLKQPKKLSSTGYTRGFHECDCWEENVCFGYRRPRLEIRCKCGGHCKRECDHNHEGALNYTDNFTRKERHRCKKSLVCLYCDKPRNKCICRMSARRCTCCKLSGDFCKCQDQEVYYSHGRTVPSEGDNDQLMCVPYPKSKREIRHSRKDTYNYSLHPNEKCHCYDKFKSHESNNSSKERSKPNGIEYEIIKGRFCKACGKNPCTCKCSIKKDDKGKVQRNLHETMNSEVHTHDSKIRIRCKCDYYLPASGWKHYGCAAHHAKQIQRKSKCCYSESSVCT